MTAARTVASPRLWQVAGGLALAHVVLMLVGIALQSTPTLTEGEEGIRSSYAEGDLTRILAGGYVEVVAFMLLLPVVVFLAQALGQTTAVGRWASASAGAFGIGYVALTIGSGFAPGAAALWGTHHGLDATTALAVNDIRNFAYLLGLAVLGAHALGVASAATADGWRRRSVGRGGFVVGVVLLASLPFAGSGLADIASLVWIVWWVALAVGLLREGKAELPAGEPLVAAHAQ